MSDLLDLPGGPPQLDPAEPDPSLSPRPARASATLPWLLAGLSVVTLAGVTLYGKKVVDDQTARTVQAQRLAEEYGARTGRLEQDRKDALRQTMDLSQKLDELGATRSSLTDQLKDKEAALAALNQRHDALVNELRAALKSSKSKSALQKHVGQALAHDASAAADATGAATTGRPRHTRK